MPFPTLPLRKQSSLRRISDYRRSIFVTLGSGLVVAGVVLIALFLDQVPEYDRPRASVNYVFLVVALVFYVFHISMQYLSRGHVEYALSLFSIVVTVQSGTLLITDLVLLGSSSRSTPFWEPLSLALGFLFLLGLVAAQSVAAARARHHIQEELERLIWKNWNPGESLVRGSDVRRIANVALIAKKVVPVDFSTAGHHGAASVAKMAGHPAAWGDLKELLRTHGIHLTVADLNSIRGTPDGALHAVEVWYWYSGMGAALIGSLTIAYGGAVI